jgi:hypothetical protein
MKEPGSKSYGIKGIMPLWFSESDRGQHPRFAYLITEAGPPTARRNQPCFSYPFHASPINSRSVMTYLAPSGLNLVHVGVDGEISELPVRKLN